MSHSQPESGKYVFRLYSYSLPVFDSSPSIQNITVVEQVNGLEPPDTGLALEFVWDIREFVKSRFGPKTFTYGLAVEVRVGNERLLDIQQSGEMFYFDPSRFGPSFVPFAIDQPGPWIDAEYLDVVAGVIWFRFVVSHQDAELADVAWEYSPDNEVTWLAMTPWPTSPAMTGLPASEHGTAYEFLWFATADLPGFPGDLLPVRVSASFTGGQTVTSQGAVAIEFANAIERRTIGASGADFTNLQDAVDSLTTSPPPAGRPVVLEIVDSGTYAPVTINWPATSWNEGLIVGAFGANKPVIDCATAPFEFVGTTYSQAWGLTFNCSGANGLELTRCHDMWVSYNTFNVSAGNSGIRFFNDDLDDENDTPVFAAALTPGTYTDLGCFDDDWFSIYVPDGHTMTATIDFDPLEGDLGIEIFDAAGILMASGTGGGGTMAVSAPADNALYFLKVFQLTPGDTTYTLHIADTLPISDDAFEPNNSRAQAKPITAGTYTDLRCQDAEWFAITLAAGQNLAVIATFNNGAGDLDMELISPEGFTASASYGYDSTETVFATATNPGTWLIHVFGYSGATNWYSLEILHPGAGIEDAFEPNNTDADAASIGPGLTGPLLSADEDWYTIDIGPGVMFLIRADFDGTLADIDIEVYDDTLNLLGYSDLTGNREAVTLQPDSAPRTLLIRVIGFATTEYYLSLQPITAGSALGGGSLFNNVVHQCVFDVQSGGQGVDLGNGSDSVLMQGCGMKLGASGAGIVGNSVTDCSVETLTAISQGAPILDLTGEASGLRLAFNIMVMEAGNSPLLRFETIGTGCFFDDNCYWSPGRPIGQLGTQVYSGLTGWQGALPLVQGEYFAESYSITTDPMLVKNTTSPFAMPESVNGYYSFDLGKFVNGTRTSPVMTAGQGGFGMGAHSKQTASVLGTRP